MPVAAQQAIEIILLRQWASYIALPVFIADHEGQLLFYNEPAEALLGRRYDEAGAMPVSELSTIFEAKTESWDALDSGELPLAIALSELRPAHRRFRIKGLDQSWRIIEATAFPIEGQAERHLGAVAIFWEAHAR